jgi:hypothetical protein
MLLLGGVLRFFREITPFKNKIAGKLKTESHQGKKRRKGRKEKNERYRCYRCYQGES